jgi:hypothetical protein
MGLVMWIATFVVLLEHLKTYIDDVFSFEIATNLSWYEPYKKELPTKQAQLLRLWDELGIPHSPEKQSHGETLIIIGFEVNPNLLSVTMADDARLELLAHIKDFCRTTKGGTKKTLREFQRLTGWINWSLNVFPLLKPGLSNMYAKIAGKDRAHARIMVSSAVVKDLLWLAKHIETSSGVYVFKSITWHPEEADTIVYSDASLTGLGFWLPNLREGFQSHLPANPPKGTIFFFEALAVCSAIHHMPNLSPKPHRVTIYSDNENTVNIFNTLRASPDYNMILKSAVDVMIAHDLDIQVVHVAGEKNVIADALSRWKNDLAISLIPRLRISLFQPPLDVLGASKK